MSVIMSGAPAGNEVFQNLARILKYLSAEELRDGRLVSSEFNTMIVTHPDLLWAKNRIRLNPSRIANRWREFTNLELITSYGCPNFHFHKIDLASPNMIAFFQGLVPPKIKHLKITLLGDEGEAFFHALSRVAGNLEHLELVGLCPLLLERGELLTHHPSWKNIKFGSLRSILLQSDSDEAIPSGDDDLDPGRFKVPMQFFEVVFSGAPRLTSINFSRWSSETCCDFFQLLSSLPAQHLEGIQSLEVSCLVDKSDGSEVRKHYFLKTLKCYKQLIQLPSLRKLVLRFDSDLWEVPGISATIVEDLLRRGPDLNLEAFEIICPASSMIFGKKLDSSPYYSFQVESSSTRDSFITEEGNGGAQANLLEMRRNNARRRYRRLRRNVEGEDLDIIPPVAQPSHSRLVLTLGEAIHLLIYPILIAFQVAVFLFVLKIISIIVSYIISVISGSGGQERT